MRPDVLPDGIAALRERLGTTCRSSPTFAICRRHAPIASETPTWVDGDYAAPSTPEAYERWLDQCVAWGVETFEHDWLVEVFFGVRAMRSEPGRATAWQEGIDAAARDRGITLQWCMGTPADFAQTTTPHAGHVGENQRRPWATSRPPASSGRGSARRTAWLAASA